MPLRKNWLPSLVKNLEPLAEMVGIARVWLASRPRRMRNSIAGCLAVVSSV